MRNSLSRIYARSIFIRVAFFFRTKFISHAPRSNRSHNFQPEVAEIAFRRLTRAMGISASSSAVFHCFPPTAEAAVWLLMEGRELTPRGLPVLLSLFMCGDITTLLRRLSRSPYKAPRLTLRPHFRLFRGRTWVTAAGVNRRRAK